jgi:TM2 domain-containing membrane protein YozV
MNEAKLSQPTIGIPPMSSVSTSTTDSKASEFWMVFLLGLFLGVFGVHRFYARKFKSGIIQLLTFGGLGIWSFVDVVTILLGKFKSSTGVLYRNPKPKVAWSIFAVVLILGIVAQAGNSKNDNSISSNSGYSSSSSSHETARQLIKDKAKEEYSGKNVDITVDGPYAGEAYTVSVEDHDDFKTYTYTAKVDEGAQEVTSWELTDSGN